MIRETTKQAEKFIGVGISNTIVDFVILNILVFLGLRATLTIGQGQFLIANIISVSCAMVNSFIWNRRWTFGSKEKQSCPRLLNFF